jgi:tetratricopeptide (TPR) repeat protein
MPFTFAHPAILYPFIKYKNKLSITAFVIGSMVPDYEFFFQLKEVNKIGHGALGFFVFDLPLAYLFCYFFHNVLRNTFITNLPKYYQQKISQSLSFNWNSYASQNKIVVFYSICIGIISHFVLDAFTHNYGTFVLGLPFLQKVVFILNKSIPIYYLLQFLLSAIGLFIVIKFIHQLPKQTDQSLPMDKSYWISIAFTTLVILFIRIYFWPQLNSFWSVVIAIIGAFHYAWFSTTIFKKFIKPKLVMIVLVLSFLAPTICSGQVLSPEKKESFIQKATSYRQNEDYKMAIVQLDSILIYNSTDAGILLFKGDLQLQAKQFTNAVTTYKKLLPLNFEKTITAINLSYALFMSHKPANALQYAKMAYINDSLNTNAIVNYFNAMLWNLKTKEAATFFEKEKNKLKREQQIVLLARLYTTSGDFKKGLAFYDSLVKAFPQKYYVQEYAEVLLGKKQWNPSSKIMLTNQKLFSLSEYKGYQDKLNAYHKGSIGTEMVYFRDVAKNTRIENAIWWQQKEASKFRFMVKAGTATVTSALNEKATSKNATIHIDEQWNTTLTGQTDITAQHITANNGETYFAITGKKMVQYKPNDRKMLGIFYSTDILNFTAAILGNNIRSHNLGYVTHLMLSSKTGFYSEGSFGALNDNNERTQIFGSIYRLIRTEPTIKTGLNFSALHFSNNNITTYFSPNQFISSEIFFDYTTPFNSKFFMQTQAAAGVQKIGKQQWQNSLRFQSEIGYRAKLFDVLLKYQTSNTASATGTGYSFNWFTGKFIWKL